MNKILESTKFVVDNARDVTINKNNIKEFCESFAYKEGNDWWDEIPSHLKALADKDKLHFLLIFYAVNFCYWGDPKWTIEYKSRSWAAR